MGPANGDTPNAMLNEVSLLERVAAQLTALSSSVDTVQAAPSQEAAQKQ